MRRPTRPPPRVVIRAVAYRRRRNGRRCSGRYTYPLGCESPFPDCLATALTAWWKRSASTRRKSDSSRCGTRNPPLPANITVEQAAKFAKSLAKGEPDRRKILETMREDRIKELV